HDAQHALERLEIGRRSVGLAAADVRDDETKGLLLALDFFEKHLLERGVWDHLVRADDSAAHATDGIERTLGAAVTIGFERALHRCAAFEVVAQDAVFDNG